MTTPTLPDRIRVGDALRQLKPFMSRSSFYGTSKDRGPRWTMIDQLDIRDSGAHLTLDRRRFERWLRKLAGERATAANGRADRLGPAAVSKAPNSYGEAVATVLRAHEKGILTKLELERALMDLNGSEG